MANKQYLIELAVKDTKLKSSLKKALENSDIQKQLGILGEGITEHLEKDVDKAVSILGKVDWASLLGKKDFEHLQQLVAKTVSANKDLIKSFIKTNDVKGIQEAVELVSALGSELKAINPGETVAGLARSLASLTRLIAPLSGQLDELANAPDKIAASFGGMASNVEKSMTSVYNRAGKTLEKMQNDVLKHLRTQLDASGESIIKYQIDDKELNEYISKFEDAKSVAEELNKEIENSQAALRKLSNADTRDASTMLSLVKREQKITALMTKLSTLQPSINGKSVTKDLDATIEQITDKLEKSFNKTIEDKLGSIKVKIDVPTEDKLIEDLNAVIDKVNAKGTKSLKLVGAESAIKEAQNKILADTQDWHNKMKDALKFNKKEDIELDLGVKIKDIGADVGADLKRSIEEYFENPVNKVSVPVELILTGENKAVIEGGGGNITINGGVGGGEITAESLAKLLNTPIEVKVQEETQQQKPSGKLISLNSGSEFANEVLDVFEHIFDAIERGGENAKKISEFFRLKGLDLSTLKGKGEMDILSAFESFLERGDKSVLDDVETKLTKGSTKNKATLAFADLLRDSIFRFNLDHITSAEDVKRRQVRALVEEDYIPRSKAQESLYKIRNTDAKDYKLPTVDELDALMAALPNTWGKLGEDFLPALESLKQLRSTITDPTNSTEIKRFQEAADAFALNTNALYREMADFMHGYKIGVFNKGHNKHNKYFDYSVGGGVFSGSKLASRLDKVDYFELYDDPSGHFSRGNRKDAMDNASSLDRYQLRRDARNAPYRTREPERTSVLAEDVDVVKFEPQERPKEQLQEINEAKTNAEQRAKALEDARKASEEEAKKAEELRQQELVADKKRRTALKSQRTKNEKKLKEAESSGANDEVVALKEKNEQLGKEIAELDQKISMSSSATTSIITTRQQLDILPKADEVQSMIDEVNAIDAKIESAQKQTAKIEEFVDKHFKEAKDANVDYTKAEKSNRSKNEVQNSRLAILGQILSEQGRTKFSSLTDLTKRDMDVAGKLLSDRQIYQLINGEDGLGLKQNSRLEDIAKERIRVYQEGLSRVDEFLLKHQGQTFRYIEDDADFAKFWKDDNVRKVLAGNFKGSKEDEATIKTKIDEFKASMTKAGKDYIVDYINMWSDSSLRSLMQDNKTRTTTDARGASVLQEFYRRIVDGGVGKRDEAYQYLRNESAKYKNIIQKDEGALEKVIVSVLDQANVTEEKDQTATDRVKEKYKEYANQWLHTIQQNMYDVLFGELSDEAKALKYKENDDLRNKFAKLGKQYVKMFNEPMLSVTESQAELLRGYGLGYADFLSEIKNPTTKTSDGKGATLTDERIAQSNTVATKIQEKMELLKQRRNELLSGINSEVLGGEDVTALVTELSEIEGELLNYLDSSVMKERVELLKKRKLELTEQFNSAAKHKRDTTELSKLLSEVNKELAEYMRPAYELRDEFESDLLLAKNATEEEWKQFNDNVGKRRSERDAAKYTELKSKQSSLLSEIKQRVQNGEVTADLEKQLKEVNKELVVYEVNASRLKDIEFAKFPNDASVATIRTYNSEMEKLVKLQQERALLEAQGANTVKKDREIANQKRTLKRRVGIQIEEDKKVDAKYAPANQAAEYIQATDRALYILEEQAKQIGDILQTANRNLATMQSDEYKTSRIYRGRIESLKNQDVSEYVRSDMYKSARQRGVEQADKEFGTYLAETLGEDVAKRIVYEFAQNGDRADVDAILSGSGNTTRLAENAFANAMIDARKTYMDSDAYKVLLAGYKEGRERQISEELKAEKEKTDAKVQEIWNSTKADIERLRQADMANSEELRTAVFAEAEKAGMGDSSEYRRSIVGQVREGLIQQRIEEGRKEQKFYNQQYYDKARQRRSELSPAMYQEIDKKVEQIVYDTVMAKIQSLVGDNADLLKGLDAKRNEIMEAHVGGIVQQYRDSLSMEETGMYKGINIREMIEKELANEVAYYEQKYIESSGKLGMLKNERARAESFGRLGYDEILNPEVVQVRANAEARLSAEKEKQVELTERLTNLTAQNAEQKVVQSVAAELQATEKEIARLQLLVEGAAEALSLRQVEREEELEANKWTPEKQRLWYIDAIEREKKKLEDGTGDQRTNDNIIKWEQKLANIEKIIEESKPEAEKPKTILDMITNAIRQGLAGVTAGGTVDLDASLYNIATETTLQEILRLLGGNGVVEYANQLKNELAKDRPRYERRNSDVGSASGGRSGGKRNKVNKDLDRLNSDGQRIYGELEAEAKVFTSKLKENGKQYAADFDFVKAIKEQAAVVKKQTKGSLEYIQEQTKLTALYQDYYHKTFGKGRMKKGQPSQSKWAEQGELGKIDGLKDLLLFKSKRADALVGLNYGLEGVVQPKETSKTNKRKKKKKETTEVVEDVETKSDNDQVVAEQTAKAIEQAVANGLQIDADDAKELAEMVKVAVAAAIGDALGRDKDDDILSSKGEIAQVLYDAIIDAYKAVASGRGMHAETSYGIDELGNVTDVQRGTMLSTNGAQVSSTWGHTHATDVLFGSADFTEAMKHSGLFDVLELITPLTKYRITGLKNINPDELAAKFAELAVLAERFKNSPDAIYNMTMKSAIAARGLNLESTPTGLAPSQNFQKIRNASLLQSASNHELSLISFEKTLYAFVKELQTKNYEFDKSSPMGQLVESIETIHQTEYEDEYEKEDALEGLRPILESVFGKNPDAQMSVADRENVFKKLMRIHPYLGAEIDERGEELAARGLHLFGDGRTLWGDKSGYKPYDGFGRDSDVKTAVKDGVKEGVVESKQPVKSDNKLPYDIDPNSLIGKLQNTVGGNTGALAKQATLALVLSELQAINKKVPTIGKTGVKSSAQHLLEEFQKMAEGSAMDSKERVSYFDAINGAMSPALSGATHSVSQKLIDTLSQQYGVDKGYRSQVHTHADSEQTWFSAKDLDHFKKNLGDFGADSIKQQVLLTKDNITVFDMTMVETAEKAALAIDILKNAGKNIDNDVLSQLTDLGARYQSKNLGTISAKGLMDLLGVKNYQSDGKKKGAVANPEAALAGLEAYAKSDADKRNSKYVFNSFDGETLKYQLVDAEGNISKIILAWDELEKKVRVVSDTSTSSIDETVKKIQQYKAEIQNAKKELLLSDGDDAGFVAAEQAVSNLVENIESGSLSGQALSDAINELEVARTNLATEGEKLHKLIAKNNKLRGGTAEVRQAVTQGTRVRSLIGDIGTEDQDGLQLFTVGDDAPNYLRNYIQAYNELIKAQQRYINDGSINSSKVQDNLKVQTASVKKLGIEAMAAYKNTQRLQEASASSESQTYKNAMGVEHVLGGSKSINPADVNRNAMKQYAKEVLGVDLASVKLNSTTGKLTGVLRKNNYVVADMVVEYDKATSTMHLYQEKERESLSGMPGFLKGLEAKSKAIAQYMLSMTSIYRVLGEIRKGIQYIREIDKALTELKKVTNKTDESYQKFLKSASKTAQSLGSTISAVTEATATFAKLGYTMEMAAEMAEAAIVYKNVGDGIASAEDAADSIISTLKGFRLEASETMRIVDRFNEVGNNFAITSQGIGEALKLSASALSEGGNTLDEAIALITGANEVVNDPSSVGTALKTLTLRLRGSKTELEEMGEDVADMATTTSSLQAKLLALTGGKVDIMLDAQTFKSTTQILREMAGAWETMTDIQRASALELMGGKRQANTLSALIQNFDTVEKVIKASETSSGSALRENEVFLDSFEGRLQQLTNAVQTKWSEALDTEVIKDAIQLLTKLVNALDFEDSGLVDIVHALIQGLSKLIDILPSGNLGYTILAFFGAKTIKKYGLFDGLKQEGEETIDSLTEKLSGLKTEITELTNKANKQSGRAQKKTLQQLDAKERLKKNTEERLSEMQASGDSANVTENAEERRKELTEQLEQLKAERAQLQSDIEVAQNDLVDITTNGIQEDLNNYIEIDTSHIDDQISDVQGKLDVARQQLAEMPSGKEGWNYYKSMGSTAPAKDRDARINAKKQEIKELEGQLDTLQAKKDEFVSSEIDAVVSDGAQAQVDDLTKKLGEADVAIQKTELELKNVEVQAQATGNAGVVAGSKFKTAFNGAWKSIKEFGKQMLKTMAYMAIIQGVMTILDNTTSLIKDAIDANKPKTFKDLREEFEELSSELSEAQSELSNFETTLKDVESQIIEIQSLGELSFTKQEELEALQKQSAELERQIEMQEILTKNKQKSTNSAALSAANAYMQQSAETDETLEEAAEKTKETGEKIGGIVDGALMVGGAILMIATGWTGLGAVAGGAMMTAGMAGAGSKIGGAIGESTGESRYKKQQTNQQAIDSYAEKRAKYQQQLDEAYAKGDAEEYNKIREEYDKFESMMADNIGGLMEYISSIDYSTLSDADKEQYEAFNRMINQYSLDNGGSITNAIDSIFDYDRYEKTGYEFDKIQKQLKDGTISSEEAERQMRTLLDQSPQLQEEFTALGLDINDVIDSYIKLGETAQKDGSLTDSIGKISAVTNAFDELGNAVKEFREEGRVSTGTLESLNEKFGELDEFEELYKVLATGEGDLGSAVSNVANAYIGQAQILSDMTDEELDIMASRLKALGVLNAKEVLMARQKGQEQLDALGLAYSIDLSNYGTAEQAKLAIAQAAGLNIADITDDNIKGLAKQYGVDLENYANTEEAKIAIAQARAKAEAETNRTELAKQYNNGAIDYAEYMNRLNAIENSLNFSSTYETIKGILDNAYQDFKFNFNGQTGIGTDFDESNVADEYDKLTSNIENQQKYIQNQIDILEAKNQAVSKSYYEEQIDLEEEKIGLLNKERNELLALYKANPSEELAADLWEVEHAIQESTLRMVEFRQSIIDLYVEAFDKVMEAYDNSDDFFSDQQNYIDKYQELMELQGKTATAGGIQEQIGIEEKKMADNVAELEVLRQTLAYAMANGVEEGSKEWVDMQENIRATEDAILDNKIAIEKYREELQQLSVDAFELVREAFSNKDGFLSNQQDYIQGYADLLEAYGVDVPDEVYEKLIDIEKQKRTNNVVNLVDARNGLAQIEAAGYTAADKEWQDAYNQVVELEKAIQDNDIATAEWVKTMRELDFEKFDRFISRLDNVDSEMDRIRGLFDDDDVATEDGAWTKEGITSLGLAVQQMELAQQKSKEYGAEIGALGSTYDEYIANVKATGDAEAETAMSEREWYDRLQTLKDGQWDAIDSYEAAKDAIVDMEEARIDMIEEGINKEIEAYQELIETKKEELDAERDLYDFKKKVKDQTKDLAELDRRIASLSGSTADADVAELRKLQAERRELQESLDDTYYQHSKDSQSKALDDEFEQFQKIREDYIEELRETLEETATVIAEKMTEVLVNADVVHDGIQETTNEYGTPISNALIAPWVAAKDSATEFKNAANDSISGLISETGIITLFGSDDTKSQVTSVFTEGTSAVNAFASAVATKVGEIKTAVENSTSPNTTNLGSPWSTTSAEDGPIYTFSTTAADAINGAVKLAKDKASGMYNQLSKPWLDMTGEGGALNTFSSGVESALNEAEKRAVKHVNTVNSTYSGIKYPDYTGNEGTGDTGGGDNTGGGSGPYSGKFNEQMKALQWVLVYGFNLPVGKNARGNYSYVADGYWGATTEASLKKAQKTVGASQTGKFDKTTRDRISTYLTQQYNNSPNNEKYLKALRYLPKAAFAKGTLGTDKDQWAITDESWIGEEITLAAGKNGQLQYLKKGSAVMPADISANLVEWGKLNPNTMGLSSAVQGVTLMSNYINKPELNVSFEALVKAGSITQETLPAVKKLVAEELDKFTRKLNYAIKRA